MANLWIIHVCPSGAKPVRGLLKSQESTMVQNNPQIAQLLHSYLQKEAALAPGRAHFWNPLWMVSHELGY